MLLGEEADPRQSLGSLRARVEAEHAHRSGTRTGQADREPQQRRLPGSVRADERGHRSARNLERAGLQRPLRAVAPAEPLRLERNAHATFLAEPRCSESSASMACSSRPAARACPNQFRRERRSFPTSSPSGVGAELVTKVPWPRRPSTIPSPSSAPYALRTVFGLIVRLVTTSFTVGS